MNLASVVCCASLALSVILTPAMGQPVIFPQPLSPRTANYNIGVRYDPVTRTLTGHDTLRWHNTSTDIIHNLEFHLYLNAFRNSRSTFMRESGGIGRGFTLAKDEWGYTDVTSIRLSTGEDLTHAYHFIHPDDDNGDDKTVIDLSLPHALGPGDSITLMIDFSARLPQPPFARSGARDEYALVGQWFPKIGVYIDDAWNCHQYHANSEFFADFGVYNVRITVPENNIVGATGLEVSAVRNNDGTKTHWYHAEDVHDFAWTTSPEFVEFTGNTQNVDIRVLVQPDHRDQGQRHVEAAKTAIDYFHKWYGTYPYPNLTIVDPRRGAGGSGGMEYPTFITAGTYYGLPSSIRLLEFVIIHEFGHNYFYHLLASNEFEESWMDEGITTYAETQVSLDAYGPDCDLIHWMGVCLDGNAFNRIGYIGSATYDPTVRKAWEYYSGGSYGTNSYTKPGLFLTTLQNYLGKETMLRIMRTYFDRWKFRHPKSRDFTDVASEAAGQNLDWFFNQALYSNAVLDYSVDRVQTYEVSKPTGFDYTLPEKDSSTSVQETESTDKDSGKTYFSEVDVRRLGEFRFPVEIEAVFDNGEKIREKWDGQDLWKKYRYIKSGRLVSATVDPDHKIPLDINLTNNSKTVETASMGINSAAAHFLFWVQTLFDQPDLLNMLSFVISVHDM